tara:strand:+ start:913 stop:1272 length:360 start_codon:yes stop_codon:yes gene_type:complete
MANNSVDLTAFENILPETSLFSVCSYSLLLVTVSLVFFHMTVVKTVEIQKTYAKLLSVLLILFSIIYTSTALHQYHQRNIANNNDNSVYWYIYLCNGIVIILIEIFICFLMIRRFSDLK